MAAARIHPGIVLRKSAVTKDDQRDASIDTFLRNALRNGQAASGSAGACVDAEALAAWTEGALSPTDAAAVEAHLASCAACQQLLAVFARTAPPAEVAPSLWQRWRLQWAVPIAAVATAVAIWVAIPDDQESRNDAFAVADSALPSTQSQPVEPAAKGDPAAAEAPAPALERSEPPARRDVSDATPRAQVENREVRQEKSELESDREAPALADAAAAPPATAPPSTLAQQRQAAFAPAEVSSPDPSVRWRVLSTGQLERTTNAGQTWEPVPLAQKVAAVRTLSATTAIATTADGRQFRTDDQGKTWNPVQQ